MASGTRNIRMLINQDCFAFLADAMCEYSKKTTKFQSLRSTVQHACVSTKSLALEREDLERFIAEHTFDGKIRVWLCLLYTSPSPRDRTRSRMPSSA